MRFISKTPSYSTTAIKARTTAGLGPHGKIVEHIEDPGYIAQFHPHGLTAWEMDKARELWAGDYDGRIPRGGRLENRFGVFDSGLAQEMEPGENGERMSDERRERIEEGLLRHPRLGNKFVQVERPKVAAPWATYDDIVTAQGVTLAKVGEKIASLMDEIGADPDHVLAYERVNANRQAVIDAVEAKKNSGEVAVSAVTVEA